MCDPGSQSNVQDDESRTLHARALAGDRSLTAVLWERCHDALLRELRLKFPTLEAAQVSDAITDVILSYGEQPARYQPEKSPLDRYLRMAANSDLLNLLQKRKRGLQVVPFDPVAHDRPARNSMQEAEERDTQRAAFLPPGMAWEAFVLKLVDLFPDSSDREVIELMAEGERVTTRYAQVLGCVHLEAAAQRRQVKQAKDRIRLRLKRYGIRLHE
jgi:hypothetical protein